MVVVTNQLGSVTSTAATLIVVPASLSSMTGIWFDFDTPGQFTNNFN